MGDLELMHYAVSKSLAEVRAHKDKIEALETLIQELLLVAKSPEYVLKFHSIKEKYNVTSNPTKQDPD